MAKSTPIVLGATAISFGNEWLQTQQLNFRIPVAGLGVALLFGGVEKMSPQAGIGLSWIMFITVLFTPFHGNTPLETLGTIAGVGGVQNGPLPPLGRTSSKATNIPRATGTTGGPNRPI